VAQAIRILRAKYTKEKTKGLRKAKKKLDQQVRKAAKAYKAAGIAAHYINKEKKKATDLKSQGLLIPQELLFSVRNPEAEPTQEEFDMLLPNPSLQQAIFKFE